VEVSVIDTGCGIAPANHTRIFEAFTQATEPAGGRGKGAGIGLYVASVLLKAHGVELHCDSQLGEGARFWFRLPRL
jgi:signal transduction histidine kinase